MKKYEMLLCVIVLRCVKRSGSHRDLCFAYVVFSVCYTYFSRCTLMKCSKLREYETSFSSQQNSHIGVELVMEMFTLESICFSSRIHHRVDGVDIKDTTL